MKNRKHKMQALKSLCSRLFRVKEEPNTVNPSATSGAKVGSEEIRFILEKHLKILQEQRAYINHIRYYTVYHINGTICPEGVCFCGHSIDSLETFYFVGFEADRTGQQLFKFFSMDKKYGGFKLIKIPEFRLYSPKIWIGMDCYSFENWQEHMDTLEDMQEHIQANDSNPKDSILSTKRQKILNTLMEGLEGMDDLAEGQYLECCNFLKTLYNKQ